MQIQAFQILTIMNSGISLIMGLYMLFLRRSTAGNGTGYWAAGSLVIGVGLLFRLIPPADGYLSLVCPGVFVTLGLYLYLAGIWEFKEKKVLKWMIIGLPLADAIQSLILFFIFQSFRIQMSLHILFLFFYCLIAIYEMFKLTPGQKYLKSIFQINAISLFVFSVLLLLNMLAVLINPDFNPSTISDSGIILHIISGFVMIALTFGFFTVVNMKLDRELRSQLKSKTRFFSIIAHDLRGPIGNIMNFLELLENESDFDKNQRKEFLQALNTLSRSTFLLLQNLLEWANKSKDLSKYENERLELNKIAKENIDFFKSLAAIKSISIEFNKEHDIFISGNSNMLLTIIRNLISNAIKFTPEGGKISINTQKIEDKVRLIIIDTGEGIQPEILNSIHRFEDNVSTRGTSGEVGSGLGLVLCKEFVAQNKGTLRFDSQPGEGTTVTVEFPAVK